MGFNSAFKGLINTKTEFSYRRTQHSRTGGIIGQPCNYDVVRSTARIPATENALCLNQ